MEVKLNKRYPLGLPAENAWALLSDLRAACICLPGAALIAQVNDTQYRGLLKTQIGPAVVWLKGTIEQLSLDAGACRVEVLAKGADTGDSTVTLKLSAWIEPDVGGGNAVLAGDAVMLIHGKLAQLGSPLMMPAAEMLLTEFVANFRAAAAVMPVEAGSAPPAVRITEPPKAPGALTLLWRLLRAAFNDLSGKGRTP